jgi:predicted RNase H-like HicB family nuclease
MRYYVALIHKEAKSDFGMSFPDFPGCISAGSTLQEALAMGAEALAGHVKEMIEAGQKIPEPSSMDKVMAKRENPDGVAVMVPEPAIGDKPERVNVMLPRRLLRRIDAATKNRSRFLAEAAEEKLKRAG